ncbi:hypothetical protein [Bradyrhizobium prioriisuperbiae]|uniref:hypothetical protein n=1 Tax=Bradyrhizobium prioriisuperbiae TaxID=2854389 RepID=UPI0028EE8DF3|nr:hypothetical protein [Bradyrhizobium prioritasuperba]
MKRVVMVVLVLVGGMRNAQADNDVYNTTRKYARSDAELHADTDACAQKFGMPDNGTATSRQFKQCMLAHGWRFSHTERENTWVDPETGLTCRHGNFMGVPSSDCSNMY